MVRRPGRPEKIKLGKRSQAKGRRGERKDIVAWAQDGYVVEDKRAFEAADIKTGVDYVLNGTRGGWVEAGPHYAVQRKVGKQPNVMRAYREARASARGEQQPVAHVTFDQRKPGEFGDDVAVIDWLEFRRLVKAAHPASAWD